VAESERKNAASRPEGGADGDRVDGPRPAEAEGSRGLLAWFAGNTVAANLLMLVILVGGGLSLLSMRVEVFQDFDPGLIRIQVPYPGASPDDVESGVVERIEEAIKGIDGIDRVTSVAREGSGTVVAELTDYADEPGHDQLRQVQAKQPGREAGERERQPDHRQAEEHERERAGEENREAQREGARHVGRAGEAAPEEPRGEAEGDQTAGEGGGDPHEQLEVVARAGVAPQTDGLLDAGGSHPRLAGHACGRVDVDLVGVGLVAKLEVAADPSVVPAAVNSLLTADLANNMSNLGCATLGELRARLPEA